MTEPTFTPTDDWQDVPEGAICPPGLEYRLSLGTDRRRQARRLRQAEPAAQGNPAADPPADYALTVARLVGKERPELAGLDAWPDPWPDLARAGLSALDQGNDPRVAVEQAIDRSNGDRPAIRLLLYSAANRLFTAEEAEPAPAPECPPLPEWAQLDPALGAGAGGWLDTYTDYAAAISPMTPRSYHQSAALWLGAVAIARRLALPMAFGHVYPNLFICWLAPTTLYRKSTALDVARKVARSVFPHLMAAQDTTPEAFLSDLAGRDPAQLDALTQKDRDDLAAGRNFAAQKGWLLDEMSGLMSAAGKDYNAGLVESLLRFYDCDPYYVRSTRQQGRVIVHTSYLSLLGASTPAAMAQHMTAERLWSMGWWPRFAVLTPEASRPPWRVPTDDNPAAALDIQARLAALYDRLPPATYPTPPETRAARLGVDVHAAWDRYNKAVSYDLLTDDLDHRLAGTYGRLPTLALKVGLILAALDGWQGNGPTVELPHLARAISICEEWRASAHRALKLATQGEFDRAAQRVLRVAGRAGPGGATMRNLYRGMQDKEPAEIAEVVAQLVDVGELEELQAPTGKPGRPAKRYRPTRAG